MTTLTCIAKITAKAEFKDLVFTELQKLIAPTLKEQGCINYDLHRDNSNDCVFYFYENWQSKACLDAHLASDHIAACFAAIGECIEGVDVSELSKVA